MKIRNAFSFLAIALAAVTIGACTEKLPDQPAKSLSNLDADAKIAREAVVNTTHALRKLKDAKDTDLKVRFESFTAEVAALDSKVGGTRALADITANRVDNYFRTWEDKIASIQDSDLRAGGEERRAKALAAYEQLKGEIREVRSAYATYISGVNDVKKYLTTDLTMTGLKTVTPVIEKTIESEKEVLSKFDKASESIKKLTN